MIIRRAYELAIDPGLANTGWAVWCPSAAEFVDAGCITTESNPAFNLSQNNVVRVDQTARELNRLHALYHFRRIVAEVPLAGAKSARALNAISLAAATAVVFAAAHSLPLEVVWPKQIKAVVGSGSVDKNAVIAFVAATYGLHLFPKRKALHEHVADAMMAYHVWHTNRST